MGDLEVQLAEASAAKARKAIQAAVGLIEASYWVLADRLDDARCGAVDRASGWLHGREELARAGATLTRALYFVSQRSWTSAAAMAELAQGEARKALQLLDPRSSVPPPPGPKEDR